jgi:hypothetical protein
MIMKRPDRAGEVYLGPKNAGSARCSAVEREDHPGGSRDRGVLVMQQRYESWQEFYCALISSIGSRPSKSSSLNM